MSSEAENVIAKTNKRRGEGATGAKRESESASYTRLVAALDRVDAHVMICDRNLEIVYANKSVRDMFRRAESRIAADIPGFDSTRIVGRSIDDFHRNPESRRKMLENLSERFTSNIRFGGEAYKIVGTPVFASSGERLGVVMEWENLTVERQRQEDERQRNQQLAQILDVLGDLRITVDADGEIIDVNSQLAKFLGYSRSDLLKRQLESWRPGLSNSWPSTASSRT